MPSIFLGKKFKGKWAKINYLWQLFILQLFLRNACSLEMHSLANKFFWKIVIILPLKVNHQDYHYYYYYHFAMFFFRFGLVWVGCFFSSSILLVYAPWSFCHQRNSIHFYIQRKRFHHTSEAEDMRRPDDLFHTYKWSTIVKKLKQQASIRVCKLPQSGRPTLKS